MNKPRPVHPFSRFLLSLLFAAGLLPSSAVARQEGSAQPAAVRRDPPVFAVGEELEYRVSYSFFTIGTVKVKVVGSEKRGDRTIYRSEIIIDSNPSLSWLTDVHIRFYGETDEDVYSYEWIGDDSSSSGITYRRILFDYPNHRMFFEKGRKDAHGARTTESVDTVAVKDRGQDGLSLFFYAREHAREKQKVVVPVFIENKEATATIDFQVEREDDDIDALDYPIDVVHFEGRADFVGVFGLTGGFEGWFSNDEARVPITARLKVILGSIKVELTKWKRGTWTPPHYVE